jgi:hypothetical protein
VLSKLRTRLTYSNVVSTLCLFILLGGSAYAAVTITGKNVKNSSLTGKDVKNSSLTSSDVKNRSLLARDFKTGQLKAGPKGDAGAPGQKGTPGDPAALLSTLPSGRTLRGGFGGGSGAATSDIAEASIPFSLPLADNVTPVVVQEGGAPPANCPGTVGNPQANAGFLCVFVQDTNSIDAVLTYGMADGGDDYRFGAQAYGISTEDTTNAELWGTWAVTAP